MPSFLFDPSWTNLKRVVSLSPGTIWWWRASSPTRALSCVLACAAALNIASSFAPLEEVDSTHLPCSFSTFVTSLPDWLRACRGGGQVQHQRQLSLGGWRRGMLPDSLPFQSEQLSFGFSQGSFCFSKFPETGLKYPFCVSQNWLNC